MSLRPLLFGLLAVLTAGSALALEYRSVEPAQAILYDSPSQKAKKLYIVRRHMPLEIIVHIEGWIKVRDAEGSLAWIEASALTDKRYVVVTATTAEIRKTPSPEAPLVFEAEKWVALELHGPAQAGWARVRHGNGAAGFVRITQVWGL